MIKVEKCASHSRSLRACSIKIKLFGKVGFHNTTLLRDWQVENRIPRASTARKTPEQTRPSYDPGRNRSQATLVSGDCLPICDFPDLFLT